MTAAATEDSPAVEAAPPAWTGAELSSDPHANARKAEKVRSMFAAIARSYDLNNRLHSFWRDQAWRRAAVRMARVRPGDDVLDVACGTGDLTRLFAAASPRRVVGLDFTPEMLDIACSKSGVPRGLRSGEAPAARKVVLGRRTVPEYLDGDATNLPFENGSFDVVSIAFGIRNVSDTAAALREFRRVLRPGGRLIVLEFGRPANPLIAWGNDFYCGKVMPFTATLISGDRSGAYRYLPRSVQTYLSREEMSGKITAAGFGSVEVKPMTLGVCLCYRAIVPG